MAGIQTLGISSVTFKNCRNFQFSDAYLYRNGDVGISIIFKAMFSVECEKVV